MNIIILTNESFPIGMAATNRIISYSKGMVELGHFVKVICLRPTEIESKGIQNQYAIGSYKGIEYEYVTGISIWPEPGKERLKKLFYLLKGYFKSIKIITSLHKTEKIDCLLLVSNSGIDIILYYFLSKLTGIKYIQEKSEFPFVLMKKGWWRKLYACFYVNSFYKLFDGMIVMTKTLYNYFKNRVKKNTKLIVVPMTVEPDRFINDKRKIKENLNYIAYCGYMGGSKDGVPILIDAFKFVCNEFDNIKLYLIGDASNQEEFNKLNQKVSELKLTDKVVFTGRINREDIPMYLCNASILVLARPTSLQAKGGFPSKLGEYLSTGNPVIVTKVGEIPEYLTDCENAFLSEPDSAKAFAEKLKFVLSNIKLAKKVGIEGRKVALKHFNYKIQAKRIINFIDELNQR